MQFRIFFMERGSVDPLLSTLTMINNLFNDIAAMSPLAGGLVLWTVMRRRSGADDRSSLFSLYALISRLLVISLVVLTVSSIPRILTFTSYELANAVNTGNVTGLIVKNIITCIIVISGALLWVSLSRELKRTRAGKDQGRKDLK